MKAASNSTAARRRYRRSRALLVYWSNAGLSYFECRSGQRRTIPVDVVPLLDRMADWVTAADLQARHPELGRRAQIQALLDDMVRLGLAERETRRRSSWAWDQWMPQAAFFHFGTRDGDYAVDFLAHESGLRDKARTTPPPSPTRSLAGRRMRLASPQPIGSLGDTLRSRRTWRNFGDAPVSLAHLSTLLGLTWGVQARGRVDGQGDIVFKTSPSGGARHPMEAYVIARRVEGLAPAVYHYDCAGHALVAVGPPVADAKLVRLLAHQYYFGPSAALVVMTARFERTMWRYPNQRTYRAVLAEAGHLGQTFCLVATGLGLAPFTTMAFHDSRLERVLGVRDETESALYVVGVGARPASLLGHPGTIPPRPA